MSIFGFIYDRWNNRETEAPNRTRNKILKCFVPQLHLDTIFKENPKADKNLRILDGVRTMGLFWLVCGHAFYHAKSAPISNFDYVMEFLTTFN